VDKVVTLNSGGDGGFPLMKVIAAGEEMECELLLVAAGRLANVENLGLEEAGVEYKVGSGILVNEFCQSKTNPSIYAVGDCVADVPRLTHMSGEMAKMVVQNALAGDDWKLSSLVVPAVMYTEPEYATVGIASEFQAESAGIEVDVYRTGLEHNDRAILEGSNVGFCKIVARKGTGEILGATIVAERAGEMINEVSLCIKNKIGLFELGRNIHSYPTTGEAVQFCGVQYINKNLPRFD
jgi:pyruvate/2-oxoglutarate dehydrogenase complex dihydrolipoamide dehydrogenase (E3) component